MVLKALKVAFFGSDLFSINCLKQILPLRALNNGCISHLDIITRKPKISGRGMNHLKDVPIAAFAEDNGLRLLRADKKVDFESLALQNYDVCIAVSYGRLIPFMFLNSLKYGGLNVHPSILPKYSGPAPLQRALLNKETETGVTVQTLHPTEFDKGDILMIEKYEIKSDESLASLSQELSIKGGIMLKKVLENELFNQQNAHYKVVETGQPYSYATKITKAESQIDWSKATSFDLIRKENTLGPLFTFKEAVAKKKSGFNGVPLKRVVLSGFLQYNPSTAPDLRIGQFALENEALFIKTLDGFVSPKLIKTEGFGSEIGIRFFNSLKKKFGTNDTSFVTNN